jgi:hypothetical protein
VAEVLARSCNCIRFRISLHGETMEMLNKLLHMHSHASLTDGPDKVSWFLTKSSSFSVKSIYLVARNVLFP